MHRHAGASTRQSKKPLPRPRLIKALSMVGLLFLLAFPVGMLFAGFATLEIECTRLKAGEVPDCAVREVRLLGLIDRRAMAVGVSSVGYLTRDVDTTSRTTLASTVVLHANNGSIPLSRALSSTDRDSKTDAIGRIQGFLDSPLQLRLSLHMHERNLFGWIGIVYVALFALAYLAWLRRKWVSARRPRLP